MWLKHHDMEEQIFGKFLGTRIAKIGRTFSVSWRRKGNMRPLLRGGPKLFPKKGNLWFPESSSCIECIWEERLRKHRRGNPVAHAPLFIHPTLSLLSLRIPCNVGLLLKNGGGGQVGPCNEKHKWHKDWELWNPTVPKLSLDPVICHLRDLSQSASAMMSAYLCFSG